MGKQKRIKQQNQDDSANPVAEKSFIDKHFLKLVLGVLTLAVVLIASVMFLPNLNKAEPVEVQINQEVYNHGKILYEANCASCHGLEGAGNMQAQIPALDGSMHSWHHDDTYLINQILYGGTNMPAVGANLNWTQEDAEAVLTYFKQWWKPQHKRAQPGSIGE